MTGQAPRDRTEANQLSTVASMPPVTFASNVHHSIYTARALQAAGLLQTYVSPIFIDRRSWLSVVDLPVINRRVEDGVWQLPRRSILGLELSSRLVRALPLGTVARRLSLIPYDLWHGPQLDGRSIFHSHSLYFRTAAHAARRNGSFVVCDHRSNYPGWNGIMDPAHDRLMEEFDAADLLLTASELSRQTFIGAGISPHKVLSVPLGADSSLFRSGKRTPSRGTKRIIFAGRVTERKGALLLAQAVAGYDGPSELRFLGPATRDVARQIGRIFPGSHFAGQLSRVDLAAELKQADVLVLPSYSDSFGLVVLEAMTAGTPVIVSDATGACSIVEAADCGVVAPVGEVAPLVQAFGHVLSSDERWQILSARAALAAKQYSWSGYSRRLIEAYQSVVLPRAGHPAALALR